MDSLVAHIVEKILNLVDLLQLVCNNISRIMEEIAKKLQQKGYRFTKQRQEIFDALTTSPQSVEEIIISLKNIEKL